MKKMLVALCLIAALPSCKKSDDTGQGSTGSTVNPVVTPTVTPTAERPLSSEDSIAAVNIRTEYAAMRTSLDSMLATPHHTVALHWDSVYHHHDSLLWHHHSSYHHDSAAHDDHHHAWTGYDPGVDHTHHYHHTYPVPGHEHDSLVVVTDHHAHDNTDNHFHGHGWHDHHLIDSIHHVYSIHHP